MRVIPLSPLDLGLAALLVVGVALLSRRLRLGVGGQLLVAGLRTVAQLLLVGLVLKALFEHVNLGWLALMALFMLAVAAREVWARQQRPFIGPWGYGIGAASLSFSAFSVTLLSLTVFISPEPWYQPQYAIPLLGMMLGNAMNGVALALERLTAGTWQQRAVIETRLSLGQGAAEALGDLRRESVRVGLVPVINAMAAAGVVSLPGMMTGQILAGSPPLEAVRYQILIMFMLTGTTGLGTVLAVWIGARHLFDTRERLRLDRLRAR